VRDGKTFSSLSVPHTSIDVVLAGLRRIGEEKEEHSSLLHSFAEYTLLWKPAAKGMFFRVSVDCDMLGGFSGDAINEHSKLSRET